MKRAVILLVALATSVLATAVAATASPARPIELTESIDFVRPPGQPPAGTFTLSGLGTCESGTFVDEFVSSNVQFTHLIVLRHYTCADGSGTFSALMVFGIEPNVAAGTEDVAGTWVIRDGTGELATLRGAGRASGTNVNCTPRCTGGTSTVDAVVHVH